MSRFLMQLLGGAAMIVAASGLGYGYGRSSASAACNTAALEAELAAVRMDRSIAREAADDAERREGRATALAQTNQEKRDALDKELAERDLADEARDNAEEARAAEAEAARVPVDGKCPAPVYPRPRLYRDPGMSDGDARRLRGIGPR